MSKNLPTRNEAVRGFGQWVRFAFFLGAAVGMWAIASSLDWSAFETPFAQLTLSLLAGGLLKAFGVAVAVVVWATWAFTTDDVNYVTWSKFGAILISIGVVAAWVMS